MIVSLQGRLKPRASSYRDPSVGSDIRPLDETGPNQNQDGVPTHHVLCRGLSLRRLFEELPVENAGCGDIFAILRQSNLH